MIVFKDWQIYITGTIARQYDNLSRRIDVIGDLPEGFTWRLLVQCGSNADTILLTPTDTGVGAVLTADNLSVAGEYAVQLKGTAADGVTTRHTNIAVTCIPRSMTGVGTWPQVPTEFAQIEANITELYQHPPVPGSNGYWLVWDPDADEYVESQLPLPEATTGGTSDHSKLKNRDAADQHPMSAITGLEDALAGKQPTGNYLTKEQDPTVPDWAKQPQKPAYTAQEVGALPATTHIPTALSELSEDATHRVVTDAEKAAWNAKSNFTGSYNDLTDKPTIPDPYTLPVASSTVLGGVQPVSKTDEMTQSVGVDEAGGLWAVLGSGGGGDGAFELIDTIDWSTEEMAAASAGRTYTLSGATDVLILWSGMVNSTSTNSAVEINFNDMSIGGMFVGALPTGKSGSPLTGYTLFKLLPRVGYTYIGSSGAVSSTNYSRSNPIFPYNLFPDTSEKITKIAIANPATQYYTVGGITKIYVR